MTEKKVRNLSRDGRYSLRLHAAYTKCMYCGRFINFHKDPHGWYDPTGPGDWEPREPIPYHKACKESKG